MPLIDSVSFVLLVHIDRQCEFNVISCLVSMQLVCSVSSV